MTSSSCWTHTFMRDGYAHFPQIVTAEGLAAARSTIDRDMHENYSADRQVEYDNQSFCPALLGTPEIMNLVREAAIQERIGELLQPEAVVCDDGQIAIRQAHNADSRHVPVPHIDGIPTPNNGMDGDELRPFTMLLGVFLSDVVADFSGNFTVWPGSHLLLAEYFAKRGERARREGMPAIPLGQPKQLLCKAGDVVLCHYNLAHGAAVNTSDFDRYAVFFRFTHRTFDRDVYQDAPQTEWKHLTKIWTDWKVEPEASKEGFAGVLTATA